MFEDLKRQWTGTRSHDPRDPGYAPDGGLPVKPTLRFRLDHEGEAVAAENRIRQAYLDFGGIWFPPRGSYLPPGARGHWD
jgi:hypothetical protein